MAERWTINGTDRGLHWAVHLKCDGRTVGYETAALQTVAMRKALTRLLSIRPDAVIVTPRLRPFDPRVST